MASLLMLNQSASRAASHAPAPSPRRSEADWSRAPRLARGRGEREASTHESHPSQSLDAGEMTPGFTGPKGQEEMSSEFTGPKGQENVRRSLRRHAQARRGLLFGCERPVIIHRRAC